MLLGQSVYLGMHKVGCREASIFSPTAVRDEHLWVCSRGELTDRYKRERERERQRERERDRESKSERAREEREEREERERLKGNSADADDDARSCCWLKPSNHWVELRSLLWVNCQEIGEGD